MDLLTDIVIVIIGIAVTYPWIPATLACLAVLLLVIAVLRWVEGPTLDTVEPTEHGPFA